MTMLTVLKGTPTTYNKDFQEDKEALFDTVDTVSDCLQIATGTLSTLAIRPDKMLAGLSADPPARGLGFQTGRLGPSPKPCEWRPRRWTRARGSGRQGTGRPVRAARRRRLLRPGQGWHPACRVSGFLISKRPIEEIGMLRMLT